MNFGLINELGLTPPSHVWTMSPFFVVFFVGELPLACVMVFTCVMLLAHVQVLASVMAFHCVIVLARVVVFARVMVFAPVMASPVLLC